MKGAYAIPALHLETMQGIINAVDRTPNMFFSNMFPTSQYPSDTIKWEIEYTSSGMTPFVAPGAFAPTIGIDGFGSAQAAAAYLKEKMYFDELFLNNMRKPGTTQEYMTAEMHLARGLKKLALRSLRRREWMMSKMFVDGSITYLRQGGVKISYSYGVPANHIVTLGTDYKWNTGTLRNIVSDVFTGVATVADDSGEQIKGAVINSTMLRTLMLDSGIQDLLKKSNFGEGNLFSNPRMVIASLLGIPQFIVYDDYFEITAWLTGAVTGGSTTSVTVDDATDFEVGGTLRFYDMRYENKWEDRKITAVDKTTNTVTIASAPAGSYVVGRDRVSMRKKYIDDNVFFMYSDTKNGEKVAEMMEAPYGLGRHYGMTIDTKDEWDPEGIWLRLQDKCFPVLYNPDTTYKIVAW